MPRVSFADYDYFPELTSSWSEKVAFINLDTDDKDKLLLTYIIGQVDASSSGLAPAIQSMAECVEDRYFILDISKHLAPSPYEPAGGLPDARAREKFQRETLTKEQYDAAINELLNHANGFAAWRNFVEQWDKAIPILQFTKPQLQARSILRQAAKFAADERSFAIRITRTDAADLYPIISNIFAVIDRPSDVLFILDMGQARSQMDDREAFVLDAITEISSLVGERDRSRLKFLCTGGSFPKSVPNSLNERSIHEREIWDNLVEGNNVKYGDYGSMQRLAPTTTFRPADFRAAVTLPMHTSWLCWRSANANDVTEWRAGATAIAAHEYFDTMPECWGKELIRRGANGDTQNIESNKHWIAARINMHIKRQIDYSEELLSLDAGL